MIYDIYHQLWVHPTKRRYYRLRIHTDLLGSTSVVRTWGSLDDPKDGLMINTIDRANIANIVSKVGVKRTKAGYTTIDNQPLNV